MDAVGHSIEAVADDSLTHNQTKFEVNFDSIHCYPIIGFVVLKIRVLKVLIYRR